MNRTLAPLFAFALALVPAAASADVQYHEVPVLDVEPIMTAVEVVEPQERCWFENTRERPRFRRGQHSATTPLLGALIGGAVGNAVGHNKRNKQIGAIVGAAIGGSIGHDISRRDRERAASVRRIRTVQREVCEVVDRTSVEQRVTGYMVTYRYAGDTYRARMAERPGESIRIRVRVTPVPVS